MKYQKRLHWDRYRPEFLKIGFICALAMALMAFNYTTSPPVIVPFEIGHLDADEILIPPTTVHQKKELPPPPPEKINVVEIELTPEPVVLFVEKVEFVEKAEIVEHSSSKEFVGTVAPIVELVKEESEEEGPILFAERMPVYGECSVEEMEVERRICTNQNLIKHTYANVKYPAAARTYEIEGTVVVSFIVNILGDVEDVKIVKDIGMGCGDEVIRAIKKLGKFIPGKQNGRPVSVIYRLPVKFNLQ